MKTLDVHEKVIDCIIAHEITISSDKGEIKGNGIQLANRYGWRPFIMALDKYLKQDKVKIKCKRDE